MRGELIPVGISGAGDGGIAPCLGANASEVLLHSHAASAGAAIACYVGVKNGLKRPAPSRGGVVSFHD